MGRRSACELSLEQGTSLMGPSVGLNGSISRAAAAAGSLPCLHLAPWHKDKWDLGTLYQAGSKGHANCLSYAVKHGCPFGRSDLVRSFWGDTILCNAVREEHLACVEVLVAHACPHEPCLYGIDISNEESSGVNPLRCLQHLLDNGWPVHPGTLIWAACRGDLDAMRFLHTRGAPLWEAAYDEEPEEGHLECKFRSGPLDTSRRTYATMRKTITIPQIPEDADSMWAPLRYGWVMGALVTPVMEEEFEAQRAATRATLLCFHSASRLSLGEGSSEQRATWDVMGRLPAELVDKIILNANFEIVESLRRPFQSTCNMSMRVHKSPNWWLQDVQIPVYAGPHDPDDENFISSIL